VEWRYSSTPRPLYFLEKSPWFPWDLRIDRLQSLSGRSSEEKKILSLLLPGMEHRSSSP